MHDLQAVFQKLDSCHKPTGHPRPPTLDFADGRSSGGLTRKSKRYATNPDLAWRVLVTFVIGMALLAAGFFR